MIVRWLDVEFVCTTQRQPGLRDLLPETASWGIQEVCESRYRDGGTKLRTLSVKRSFLRRL
jgi:hypothetical protein